MHPILFEIPGLHFKIHMYGVMYALAFLLAMVVIRRESVRLGLNVDKMMDLFFYALVIATLSSRLFYVFIEEPSMLRHPLDILKLWQGGLVFYGGLIGALITGIVYCRKAQLPFWKVIDVYAVAVSLGHIFGRLGCFFAGCCYGKACPTGTWYAITFPASPDAIAPVGIPLYPTQLMESVGNLIIFLILWTFRRKKSFDGQVFLLYVILYSMMRSSVELFRGDESRGYVIDGILSTSQFISLMMTVGVILIWIWRRRKQLAA